MHALTELLCNYYRDIMSYFIIVFIIWWYFCIFRSGYNGINVDFKLEEIPRHTGESVAQSPLPQFIEWLCVILNCLNKKADLWYDKRKSWTFWVNENCWGSDIVKTNLNFLMYKYLPELERIFFTIEWN